MRSLRSEEAYDAFTDLLARLGSPTNGWDPSTPETCHGRCGSSSTGPWELQISVNI